MTLLSELKAINNQRIKPKPHAFHKIAKFIKGVIDNPTDYQMDIQTRARIYSEESKKRIIDMLEQVYHELLEAEEKERSSLNRLDGIAQYFQLELLQQLSANNIDIKLAARNALSETKAEREAAPNEEKKESPTEINLAIKLSLFQKQALKEINYKKSSFPLSLSQIISSYLPSHTPRILDAANWFQDWITDNHKDDETDLLRFLTVGFGFKHIYNYEEYLDLAELLRGRGFAISAKECDLVQFAKQVMSANPSIFTEKPYIQPEAKYQILAEKLEGNIDDEYVFSFAASRLATYEEYCDLVIYLQANHLELSEPKSVYDFVMNKATQRSSLNESSLLNFTSQEESRLQFVMETFIKEYPHLSGATDNDKFLNFVRDRHYYPMVALKTYDQFCQSAKLICENHPHIVLTDPPCSPLEYAKLYFEIDRAYIDNSDKYSPRLLILDTDSLPADSEVLTQLAAEFVLDHFGNNYLSNIILNRPLALIAPYFEHIKSYEQYHSLIEILSNHCDLPFNPPNVMRYMQAVTTKGFTNQCKGQSPQLPNSALKANAIADEIVKELKDEKGEFSNTLKYYSSQFINSYEEYCALGKCLKQKGFDIPDPICSKEDYTTSVLEEGSHKIPIVPLNHNEIIKLAVDRFQWWLNNSWAAKSYQDNDDFSMLLSDFLADIGFYYIKTHADLSEFTDLLKQTEVYKNRGFKYEHPISPLSFMLLFQRKGDTSFQEAVNSLYVPELAKLLYMKEQAERLRQSAQQALKAGTFKNIKNYEEYRYLASVVNANQYRSENYVPRPLNRDEFNQILENFKQGYTRRGQV